MITYIDDHKETYGVEPACAVLGALEAGQIAPYRHALYQQLVHEASQKLY